MQLKSKKDLIECFQNEIKIHNETLEQNKQVVNENFTHFISWRLTPILFSELLIRKLNIYLELNNRFENNNDNISVQNPNVDCINHILESETRICIEGPDLTNTSTNEITNIQAKVDLQVARYIIKLLKEF